MNIKSENWASRNVNWVVENIQREEIDSYLQRESQSDCQIWTLVDGDDGCLYLANIFTRVNALNYSISRNSFDEDIDIRIELA